MKTTKRLGLLALAATAALGYAAAPHAQGVPDYKTNNKWNPTDWEVTQLPPYCQAEFRPQLYPGQKSTAAYGCGTGFNHFCPGLVVLNRAKNPLGSKKNRSYARGIAEQTLTRVSGKMLPSCPLAQDVKVALQQAKMMSSLLK